jgi:hypothetical protein
MRLSLRKRSRQTLIASIMLVAFALRGLIPPGFMPASGRPFSIEICWEDFPAEMLAHGEPSAADSMGMHRMPMQSMGSHHSGSPSPGEHCVFGTACSAGPIPHLPLLSELSSARQLRAVAFVSFAAAIRLVHLPQPRAPPGRLS